MKKLVIIVMFFFFLLSCESQKGSWTYEDKERARKELESGLLKDGGNQEYIRESIDCSINRLELYYENFQEVEFDPEGAAKIIGECVGKNLLEELKNDKNSPAGE